MIPDPTPEQGAEWNALKAQFPKSAEWMRRVEHQRCVQRPDAEGCER